MKFKDFVRQRREELHLTQMEMANRLSSRGHETSHARISHWESGRNAPPIEDRRFRQALADVLEIDEETLLETLGYPMRTEYTAEGRRAASIIDRLSTSQRELAIGILEQIAEKAGV